MNKNVIIGIVAVVLVAGGIYWFTQSQNSLSNTLPHGTTNSPSPTTVPTPTPAPNPVPAAHVVMIQNFAFNQSSITIKKGDTVTWTNKDSAEHTVTGNSGGPSSPTIGTNGTYSYTFNSVGTFSYHCAIHPSMTGTVIVTQ